MIVIIVDAATKNLSHDELRLLLTNWYQENKIHISNHGVSLLRGQIRYHLPLTSSKVFSPVTIQNGPTNGVSQAQMGDFFFEMTSYLHNPKQVENELNCKKWPSEIHLMQNLPKFSEDLLQLVKKNDANLCLWSPVDKIDNYNRMLKGMTLKRLFMTVPVQKDLHLLFFPFCLLHDNSKDNLLASILVLRKKDTPPNEYRLIILNRIKKSNNS